MPQDLVKHRDGTVSVNLENLMDRELEVAEEAWLWFLAKTPEERATAIVRAYLDRGAWEAE